MHVPGCGGAALGAQAAMDADVLVLHHHPPGLLQRSGNKKRRSGLSRRQKATQLGLVPIPSDAKAVHRANIEAGVALNDSDSLKSSRCRSSGTAALRGGLFRRNPSSTSRLRLWKRAARSTCTIFWRFAAVVVVVVAPFAQAHLRAGQARTLHGPLGDRHALAVVVDRDGRLMAVLHRPDNVPGPKAASPPKKTPGRVDLNVALSTTGMSHLPNSIPMSCSIHGNAFSWPIASITLSTGMNAPSITSVTSIWLFGIPLQATLIKLHALEDAVLNHEPLRRHD